jgi:hypothetical protein
MYPPLLRPTAEWRAGVPKSFPACLEYLKQHPFTPIGGWLGLLSPEWPDRPYLSIEADERISRIEQIRKYYATLPASPIAAFLRNPLIPVKSRVDWDLISPMLEDQLNRSPDKMSIPNVTVGEGSDQVSTVILQLDWSRGRTEILRAFGDLLSGCLKSRLRVTDHRRVMPITINTDKLYDTDLTDAAWALIAPMLPAARRGGRPRTTNIRAVLNAIFYLLRTGCQWRLLPREFPVWSTVYHYFRVWKID